MVAVGIGHRQELVPWIDACPPEIECLEVIAEHFADPKRWWRLRALAEKYPLAVHCLGLSLGTPGPLDRGSLALAAEVAAIAEPLWISDHIGFSRTSEIDLGHFNPVPPTMESVHLIADHAREVMEVCARPLLLENITTNLMMPGKLSETEFLNRLLEESGCGMLLDVTNLYVNSRNHGFDPRGWLHEIDSRHITQLHVVGYRFSDQRWHDMHDAPIQAELWHLIAEVMRYANPKAVIIERDGKFPPVDELESELRRLKTLAMGAPYTASEPTRANVA